MKVCWCCEILGGLAGILGVRNCNRVDMPQVVIFIVFTQLFAVRANLSVEVKFGSIIFLHLVSSRASPCVEVTSAVHSNLVTAGCSSVVLDFLLKILTCYRTSVISCTDFSSWSYNILGIGHFLIWNYSKSFR